MRRYILGLLIPVLLLTGFGCPPTPSNGGGGGGPAIIVEPAILSIPTGGTGEFDVSLSADPGGPVTVDVLCIAGGCGFTPDNAQLFFDSSNFAIPQTVFLSDIGFHGRGESVFEVSGDNLNAVNVTVIRD